MKKKEYVAGWLKQLLEIGGVDLLVHVYSMPFPLEFWLSLCICNHTSLLKNDESLHSFPEKETVSLKCVLGLLGIMGE